jgi:hypothetical protein
MNMRGQGSVRKFVIRSPWSDRLQEAVFGGEVALDAGEAQHALGFLVREEQRGQAAHRMPDQVAAPDADVPQRGLRRPDQERDRTAAATLRFTPSLLIVPVNMAVRRAVRAASPRAD